MGHYISIRGWLECPESQIGKIREIIESFVLKAGKYGLTEEGAKMYNLGWHIPDTHINWTHYIFYGADIRIQCTDYIKDQVKEISETIYEIDGEFTDYTEGIFDLDDEENEVSISWLVKDQNIEEKKR